MPNAKISVDYRNSLVTTVGKLLERRLNQIVSECPLTHTYLQYLITPADDIAQVQDITAKGFLVYRGNNLRLKLLNQQIPRPLILNIYSSNGFIMTPQRAQLISIQIPETDVETINWSNNVVDEMRLMTLVKRTIADFLSHYADTAYHLIARWPDLAILADHVQEEAKSVYDSPTQIKLRRTWRERLTTKPRSLKPYRWSDKDEWPVRYKKAMSLSNITLLSAMMLPKIDEVTKDDLKVSACSWVKAPDDLDVPPAIV